MGLKEVQDFELIGSTNQGWMALMHPSGLLYYYKASKRTFTAVDISNCTTTQLVDFEAWINASRNAIVENTWILVVEPVRIKGDLHNRYEYYYVVEDWRIITWHHIFNVGALFQECVVVQGWDHRRHELEAQFWKHMEYFPHDFNLQRSDLLTEALTIEESTAVSTFGTLDKLQKIMTVLATICEVTNDGNPVNKSHVALFGA
ncbi:hypothetical protein BDN67DRAFT_1016572 [Paxillus ammoniavirescens]|nr:hypothetical protein BDN67DRAFT_1016572 [Paxillus ammoniavirescens]